MTDPLHHRALATRAPARRAALRAGCATALALATLAAGAASSPARAQATGGTGTVAFQGTPTIRSGSASIVRGTTDIVTLNSAQTVIDWAPLDTNGTGTIDFLPNGLTGRFVNNSSAITDFTVLNRILPTNGNGVPVSRIVGFNGTVQSQINGATGGSVWFYAPGGIVAGPTSVFNVGNLVLTSDAIDTTGGLFGSNGQIRFRGVAGSTSAVQVQAGAQINASAAGSYVALVAPRVVQAGTVTTNGSTAYVGAEGADITINSGLFDIAITTGTSDGNGVVHSGTTNGPASQGGADPQRIYMVAVPKNNVLTMLLTGTIGYTAAGAAVQDNSGVVLSAGYDVQGGEVADISNGPATQFNSIYLNGPATFNSDLVAKATQDVLVIANLGQTVRFNGNADLYGGRQILVDARVGGTVIGNKDMNLYSSVGNIGGTITVQTRGGSGYSVANGMINVAGDLALYAGGDGDLGVTVPPAIGADATGGVINVIANGGTISAASLTADATGYSGYGTQRSGNARGGTIALSNPSFAGPIGAEGGTLQFGSTTLDASAAVPFLVQTPSIDGGNAFGGAVVITGSNGLPGAGALGTLSLGVVQAKAQATGGVASSGTAGNATGGDVTVTITSGTHDWTSFNGDVTAAPGYATDGGLFGAGLAGATGISVDIGGTGQLNIANSVSLYADARSFGGGASGGTLQAGAISVKPHDGGSFTIAQDLYASAAAQSYGYSYTPLGLSADALGGTILVGASGGTFEAAGLYADASAYAADADGMAGNATGGSVTLFADMAGGRRGQFALSGCDSYSCSAYANGTGAFGTNGSTGKGGSILLYASDSDFSANGEMGLYASGTGGGSNYDGMAGRGGDGIGGSVTVESRAGATGSAAMNFGTLFASVEGLTLEYGEGIYLNGGDGGTGTGGTVNFAVRGGTLNADALYGIASGKGGASDVNCETCEGGGLTPFQAGTGQGGSATFLLDGGNATIGALALGATGTGGVAYGYLDQQPSAAALAGTGRGGSTLLDARAGTLRLGTLEMGADGMGGAGFDMFQADGTDGGQGIGGSARLVMGAGGSAQIFADSISIGALGTGGVGSMTGSDGPGDYSAGRGGIGMGGNAGLTLASGALNAASVSLTALGIGGDGGENGSADGDGGASGGGVGGTAQLDYLSEGHQIGALTLDAKGQGGVAGSARYIYDYDANDQPIYVYGNGAGGGGGNGTGGTAILGIDVDPNFASLTVSADGVGAVGGTGAAGGAGGAGLGGAASLAIGVGATDVSGSLLVSASGLGGVGGTGVSGPGGRGGDASGGSATLSVDGAGAVLTANDISVLANAIGGDGGIGRGSGLAGAAGGDALGGSALFAVTAGGAAVTGDLMTVGADATGGTGASGTGGPTGGSGGAGGNATGGAAAVQISDARMTLISGLPATPSYRITASGQGGAGAAGSDGSGTGATGGAGGNGGNATGGQASFDASNGDYALGNLAIVADAAGGLAGIGGTGPGTPGNLSAIPPILPSGPIVAASGVTGAGTGGVAHLANGGTGALAAGGSRSLNSLTMTATGVSPDCCGPIAGGRVELTDSSTAAGGGLTLSGSMRLTSSGFPANGQSGVFVQADANPVTVAGNADLTSDGPIAFAFTNGGRLAVAGGLNGFAGSTIDVTHGGRPAGLDSLSAQQITLVAQGNINAAAGSSLRADMTLAATSYGGNISAAGLFAGDRIDVEARGDVTIGDARASGPVSLTPSSPVPVGGAIRLVAGSDFQGGYGPATLTLNGAIAATGSVLGLSGGDIVANGGAAVTSDNRIELEAGDDIIVRSGASVLAAQNPIGPVGSANILDDPALLYLSAGNGIQLAGNPGTASILVDGTIGAPGRSVILSAHAIQADANPIAARSLYAYILNAPAAGAAMTSDDSGTRPECSQGNICLGAINATDIVRVGPASGTVDLANQVLIGGSVSGRDVSIRARDALRFANAGSVTGSDALLLASLTGDLSLPAGLTASSDGDVRLFAGGSISGAGADVSAGGGVGIGTSGDLVLASLISGRTPESVDADGNLTGAGLLTVPGAVAISDRLQFGPGSGRIDAASFAIGTLAADTLTLNATGAAGIGNGLLTGGLQINAGSIGVSGDLQAGSLTANAASLLALDGTTTVDGDILGIAGNGIRAGNVRAGGAIGLDGGNGAVQFAALQAGGSIDATGNGGLVGGAVTATGGHVSLSTQSAPGAAAISVGNVSAGDYVELLGNSAVSTGDITAGNDAIASAANGGSLTVGNVSAGDDVWLTSSGSDPAAMVRTGAVTSSGLGSDSAPSSAATFGASPGPAGAVILVRSQGSVATGDVSGPGRTLLVADRGTIMADNVAGTQGLFLFAPGDIAIGSATSSGAFYVADASMFAPNLPPLYDGAGLAGLTPVKTGGGFSASGPIQAGDVTIATAQSLNFTQSLSGRAVRLLSNGTVTGDALTASGPLTIDGLGGVAFDRLASGGATSLSAANGTISVATDIASTGPISAQGRAVALSSLGDMQVAQAVATAGDIALRSAAGVTLGGASASNGLQVSAAGTARFTGTATAQAISVASGDIVIGQTARLGVQGTTATLALDALGAGQTFIGGADMTGGYSLSGAEITRIAARDIQIFAPVAPLQSTLSGSSVVPDVVVGGFAMTAGANGNLGVGGMLTIATPGLMRVTGAVQLSGLDAAGGLALRAGNGLQVISGQGSIGLRDGNGGLGGVLSLDSPVVIAATLSAIDDVAAADTIDERDRRLAENDGVVSDDGLLRAAEINVGVTDGFYIQNSGSSVAYASRRGFTAQRLNIATEGSGTQIAINGRLAQGSGFATGLSTIPLVAINGVPGGRVGQYATGSKINGCLIASAGSCIVTGYDTHDTLTAVLDPTVAVGRLFSLALVELRDFVPQGYPPLIDEPVTGAGNEDLWDRPCADPDDARCGDGDTQ